MEGAPPQQQNNNEGNRASNESNFSFNIFRRAPIFGPIFTFRDLSSGRNNEREENGFFGRSSIRIISSTYSSNERNIELAPQPKINSDEIRETIAQNLLEVQNMIDFGNYNEYNKLNGFNEIKEEEKKDKIIENNSNMDNIDINFDMNCFDLNKRILAKGQWVDVKDTVDQWLDAQVIEVSEDNRMVKIHYNHWSTRWDEWIETKSPRIMPFRYHTRQSIITHYHSPFPNKKPDMGVTLLSFENLNRNSCVNPSAIAQQRNRYSSVISTSSPQSNNINNNNSNSNNNVNNNTNNITNNNINNENNNASTETVSNINNNENINTNSNDIGSNNNLSSNQNDNSNINNGNFSINFGRRSRGVRYAEPLPPIPSPNHQEPDPENHIIKNLGEDGFLGVLKEFEPINNVIKGLSSELLSEHNYNTEILTPKKLSEIQNKSYYNLKRLIPILDRTGRIYSDISTFIENSMKTNQLELLSKNLFADVNRINEDLKYYSNEEKQRITQEILSHNSRRENRSGTVNFVPPVNQFDTKLKNAIPILDTPYEIKKKDQVPQIVDFVVQNNNEEEGNSFAEENNSNNTNARNQARNTGINDNTNNNNTSNNNFSRYNAMESFNIQLDGNNEENEEKNNQKMKKKMKKFKNGYKMLGLKTKRNKSKKDKNSTKDKKSSKEKIKKKK